MKNSPTTNAAQTFSLMIVDDEPSVLSSLKRIFFEQDYQIHAAQSAREALAVLRKVKIDAALIDLKMPEMDGMALLTEMKRAYPHISVTMLTGHASISDAVKSIKLGAVDFLEKPFTPEKMLAHIAQIHKIWKLSEENRKLKKKVEFSFGFDRLIGNSTAILNLKRMITMVGPGDASILVQGETGTGKELIARAIHSHSLRSKESFVPVDCAAISETVIENELFGHAKGAFTGAHISTLGLIRSADKGTLFLDEVGELSMAMQAKLLRTLQEGEVRPVGESKTYPVDIRIVAATNRDLTEEITAKNFREDLFYRLNVVTLSVPTLRNRKEDIPLLARFFIDRFASDYSPVKDISTPALVCMENYNWPGNIRELENVIRRAMALAEDDMIMPQDLPGEIYAPPDTSPPRGIDALEGDSMEAYEKAAILNALSKCGNSRREASRILKISEATLYRKLKKFGIVS